MLENEKTEVERDGEKITLIGVKDPSFSSDYLFHDEEAIMESQLKALVDKDDGFTLLLSHRPELFEIYVTCNADLVLSGHAHGGQFRLPFIGGLAAPNQGCFRNMTRDCFPRENENACQPRHRQQHFPVSRQQQAGDHFNRIADGRSLTLSVFAELFAEHDNPPRNRLDFVAKQPQQ